MAKKKPAPWSINTNTAANSAKSSIEETNFQQPKPKTSPKPRPKPKLKQKPGRKKLEKDLIVIKAFKDSRSKLKTLASENNLTMAEMLEKIIDASYEKWKKTLK
jgi:hypothetical protein